jgi:hypothetical protein
MKALQTKGLSLEEVAGQYGDEVAVAFTAESKRRIIANSESFAKGDEKPEHAVHD